MQSDIPDHEVPLRVRQVYFLNSTPAFADMPLEGEPSAIIQFACKDEVEVPLLLSIDDARALMLGLAGALAYHDDTAAEAVLDEYRRRRADHGVMKPPPAPVQPTTASPVSQTGPIDNFVWAGPKAPPLPTTGGLRSMRLKIAVRWPDDKAPTKYTVFGAYRGDDAIYVLYRFPATPGAASGEAIFKIMGSEVHIGLTADEVLPLGDWKRFGELDVGQQFRIGPAVYFKFGWEDIRRLVHGRVFPVKFPPKEPVANVSLKDSQAEMKVTVRDVESGGISEFVILGGYHRGDRRLLLVRLLADHGHDTILRLDHTGGIVIGDCQHEELLPPSDWPSFRMLPSGARFRLNGRTWRKVRWAWLGRYLGGRTVPLYSGPDTGTGVSPKTEPE